MKRLLSISLLLALCAGVHPLAWSGRDEDRHLAHSRKRPSEEQIQRDEPPKAPAIERLSAETLGTTMMLRIVKCPQRSSPPLPSDLSRITHASIFLPQDTQKHAALLAFLQERALPSLTHISLHALPSCNADSHPVDFTVWRGASWLSSLTHLTFALPLMPLGAPRFTPHKLRLNAGNLSFLTAHCPHLQEFIGDTDLELAAFNELPELTRLILRRITPASLLGAPHPQERQPLMLPRLTSFESNTASAWELLHLRALTNLRLEHTLTAPEAALLVHLPHLKEAALSISEEGFQILRTSPLPWRTADLTIDTIVNSESDLTLEASFHAIFLESLTLSFAPHASHPRRVVYRPFDVILPTLQRVKIEANFGEASLLSFVRDLVLGAPQLEALELDAFDSFATIHIYPPHPFSRRRPLPQLTPASEALYTFMRLNLPLQDWTKRQREIERRLAEEQTSAPWSYHSLEEERLLQEREEILITIQNYLTQHPERIAARAALLAIGMPPAAPPPASPVMEIDADDPPISGRDQDEWIIGTQAS